MSEPDWAKILLHLYRNDGLATVEAEGDEDEEDMSILNYRRLTKKLRTELNLDADTHDEVNSVIRHLQRNDLISNKERKEFARILLKPDGFEVAHDRELTDRQTKTNMMLVILTLALVMATIVGNHPNQAINHWGGWIVLGIIGFTIYATEIFNVRI